LKQAFTSASAQSAGLTRGPRAASAWSFTSVHSIRSR